MAAELARASTSVVVADDELRLRTEALATEHDLVLTRANLAFLSAFVTMKDLEGFTVASELFDAAGSPSWGSFARAIGVRWAAATGRLPDAEELLAAERAESNVLTRAAIVGAAAQVALVRGVLGATARTARDELVNLRPPNSWRMHTFTHVAYESVARVAFFSGDRDVLEWAAAALSEGANSGTRVASRPSLPLISACWRMSRPRGRRSTRLFVTASSAR